MKKNNYEKILLRRGFRKYSNGAYYRKVYGEWIKAVIIKEGIEFYDINGKISMFPVVEDKEIYNTVVNR